MSYQTSSHATMAAAALAGARDARRAGKPGLASQLASSARVHAELCRRLALTTSATDMADVQRAQTAASEAEDFGPEMGGDVSGVQPQRSWRNLSPGVSVAVAKSRLEQIHQRGVRRGFRATESGTRSLFESRW